MDKNWVDSLHDWFERKSGLLYTIYSFSFVVSNWKFFYVLFFSSTKDGSDRVGEATYEFIHRTFFGFHWGEWYVLQFLIPAFFTLMIVKVLPKLNNLVYDLFLEDEEYRELAKAIKDNRVAKKLAALKKDESQSLQSAQEHQDQINELLAESASLRSQLEEVQSDNDETKRWDKYISQNEADLTQLMNVLTNVVYGHNGNISGYSEDGDYNRYISHDQLAKADTLGLIDYDTKANKIVLKSKGKYFYTKIMT